MVTSEYIVWRSGENIKLTDNFWSGEFESSEASINFLSSNLVKKLQKAREEFGKPIKITHGYRTTSQQKNMKLKGYRTSLGPSQHEYGAAADISTNHLSDENKKKLVNILEKHFKAMGIGKTFIHVDLRGEKIRRWGYE